MFKTTVFVAAAVCTVGLFSAPASFAAPLTSSREVRYNDLDLATAGGQEQLQSRIRKAARTVCSSRPSTGTRLEPVDRVCFAQAMSQVREQVASAIEKSDDTRLGG
ncbi:UrcA family protein [Novosphingobium sp. FGD1]|jgi:UrcA family protein|uniref:UrcA family protein n=1 Tax=Novosphingobium silvae TaxID=2692619 RepID=A0A7X4GDE1_9SPHN|nr:UrcA family protein [Novosphingobium silvae]MYL96585.1 UrcA family protein [Novosphingobium silvae]